MDNISGVKNSQEWCSTFATTCWKLWTARNEEIFQDHEISNSSLSFSIHAQVRENLRILQNEKMRKELQSRNPQFLFQDEQHNTSKVILWVDAALCRTSGIAACGGALRLGDGSWLAGFCLRLGICPVDAAELWAVYYGVALARAFNLQDVRCFSDSMAAVSQIHGKSENLTLKNLVMKVQRMMAQCATSELHHTKRNQNIEANYLAKVGLALPVRQLHIFSSEVNADSETHHPDVQIPISSFINSNFQLQGPLAHLLSNIFPPDMPSSSWQQDDPLRVDDQRSGLLHIREDHAPEITPLGDSMPSAQGSPSFPYDPP